MSFIQFRNAINTQLDLMLASGNLFEVDVDKDELWNLYLDSFPAGTNEIYRERRQYDCSCCRSFIKNLGAVVTIQGNEVVSIWDAYKSSDALSLGGSHFGTVCEALSKFVTQATIKDLYMNDSKQVGVKQNHESLENGSIKTWDHFHYVLPNEYAMTSWDIASYKGEARTNKEVLERSLKEITLDAVDIVLDLIDQGSLYRGEEHKGTVKLLKELLKAYNPIQGSPLNEELFFWSKSVELKKSGRFRNTVIGTLLVDISEGVDLEVAVKKFEDKVAPQNYKRTSAPITQGMVKKAQAKSP